MAISFPITLADFFEQLGPIATSFELGEGLIANETGGGEVIRSAYGTRLWSGSITLHPRRPVRIDDLLALIRVLQEPDASFLLYPLHRPQAYAEATVAIPTGAIDSLGSDNRLISLKSLPAGFQITRGDFLSFTYLTGPVRYALHQAAESITANGSGVTGQFQVIPPIRPGATVGANVRLNKPILKAVLEPNSLTLVDYPKKGYAMGASFRWRQTLR